MRSQYTCESRWECNPRIRVDMITTISDSHKFPAMTADGEPARGQWQSLYVRYFFVVMGVVFVAITALGFVPQLLYFHAQKIPLHWFTHVHGAVMTTWLALFLGQAVLAAMGRLKYHRALGIFSAGWAVVVWVTSIVVVFSALIRGNPPEQAGQFATVALSLAAMILFGLFFSGAMRNRKNALVHKRLILLAMIPLMSAGVDRIGWLPALQNAYFVRFIYLDLLLIPLVIYDFATVRRIHRITLIGAAGIIASQGIVAGAAVSPAWHQFVYRALTPYVTRLPEISLSETQSNPLLGAYGSKDWQMMVGREGGKLYLQMPGLPKWDLGAYSETKLFLKIAKAELNFVKDSRGLVTKILVTETDKTWEAARVPQP